MSVAKASADLIAEWENKLAAYGLSERQLGLTQDHESRPAVLDCTVCGQPLDENGRCEDCTLLLPCDGDRPIDDRLRDGFSAMQGY